MTQTPDYSFPQLNSNSEPFENDEDVDFWESAFVILIIILLPPLIIPALVVWYYYDK
jgi:hypothetical protein